MGAIFNHDIKHYIDKYKLKYYIETGTGMGGCLDFCRNFNFEKCISIEIHDEIYKIAKEKFKDDSKCELHHGNSYEVLKNILKNVNDSSLFFLDAHFPGADFGYADYSTEKNMDTRLPLQKELEVIFSEYKFFASSVFIIDDLRIYEDDNYTDGNWKDRVTLGGQNINFVFDTFNHTHIIQKDLRYQGFFIIEPNHFLL